jgi:hypothetical protein
MAAINLESVNSANWMAALPDRTRLFDVVVPGSHDTGSFGFTRRNVDWNPTSWAVQLTSDLNVTTLIQTNEERSDFRTQLDNGIRFWDLRLTKTSDSLGSNLNIFHGPFYVGTSLSEALAAAQQFLEQNPGETLVISLKKENNFLADATSEITAADMEAYLQKYRINSKLPAANNSLWVAGPSDFQAIAANRASMGLADLNRPGSGFELETRNPRQEPGVKLSYENLTLGDARGKIILHMRDFSGYGQWNDSGIVALDGGTYSSGIYFQDNYEGPQYQEKKDSIRDAAKGIYGNTANTDSKFWWNFTSATTGVPSKDTSRKWVVDPAKYALHTNAGSSSAAFKTEGSPSLKTMLSSAGELATWNLEQKRSGQPGLKGAIAGDYYLAPQSWYDEYWNSGLQYLLTFPNLNSSSYGVSDHLTQLIWRQNALYLPSFIGATRDSLTGLPNYQEGASGSIKFLPFLGDMDKKGLKYRVAQVTAEEAGLSESQIASVPIASPSVPVTFSVKPTNRASRKNITYSPQSRVAVGKLQPNDPNVRFAINATPNQDGYSFFRLDFLDPADNSVIGMPSYFSVNDL